MTDDEIIKALECCTTKGASCKDCPAFTKVDRSECKKFFKGALDLINRQKAEIERLKKHLQFAEECIAEVEDAAYRGGSNDYIDSAIEKYNNLVKEMTEDEGK